MKKFIILLLATSFAFTLKSQTPEHEWTKVYRDTTPYSFDRSQSYGIQSVTDDSGNIYTIGQLSCRNIDIDPDSGVNIIRYSYNGTQFGGFLLKQNKKGKTVWFKGIGSVPFVSAIVINKYNQIFIASIDLSIWCFDSNGTPLWNSIPRNLTQDRYEMIGSDISIDTSGNPVLIGYFSNTIILNSNDTFTSRGGFDIILIKYSRNGNFLWAKPIGGKNNDIAYQVKLDNKNNIYITGSFDQSIQVFSNGINLNIFSNGGTDILIAKFDNNGNNEWADALGTSKNDARCFIDISASGDIYLVGNFIDSFNVNFRGRNTLYSRGNTDFYISKYNTDGFFQWVKHIGEKNDEKIYDFCLDIEDNINLFGFINGTLEVDPSINTKTITPIYPNGLFVLSLNKSGSYRWDYQLETNVFVRAVYGGLHVSDKKDILLTGGFQGDFHPNKAMFSEIYSTWHFSEIFITKLNQCDLTAKVLNKGVTLISNIVGAQYQWIDCKTGKELPNSTSIAFTPSSSGSYAVIITDGKCVDTSDCIEFILKPSNISDIEKSDINIFPNPSTGIINFNSNIKIENILVYDMNGKQLKSYTFHDSNCQINLENLNNGMYLIKIVDQYKNTKNNLIILNK